jgi:biotin-(acetyl-CoA carboxylase) ligase
MQQRHERDVQVNQLPRAVQETLRDDYEDWRPSEAKIVSDPETHEEGAFYQVKLNKTDDAEQETKVVMIANDGEVIDEMDGEEFERETQRRRGTEGQPGQQDRQGQYDRQGQQGQQDRQGQYDRQGQQGQQDRQGQQGQQDRQGQQGQYGQQGQQHMQQRQERDVQVTQLPQAVQETLRDDYEDWRPSEAKIVTDTETHEEGAFYQVKLNKTDDGEQKTKVVMIANDGEVIDEKDGEEFERETQRRKDSEKQRRQGTEGQRRY